MIACGSCGSQGKQCSLLCPVERNLSYGWHVMLPGSLITDRKLQLGLTTMTEVAGVHRRGKPRFRRLVPKRIPQPSVPAEDEGTYLTARSQRLGDNLQCAGCGLINKRDPCDVCRAEWERGSAYPPDRVCMLDFIGLLLADEDEESRIASFAA